MAPSRTSVLWDFEQGSVKYEESSAMTTNSPQCKGTTQLKKGSIDRFLAKLRVCSGKVEQLSSDDDRNTLTLVYEANAVLPNGLKAELDGSTRRVVLSNKLNEAVVGPQQFACAGFQELDRFLKEKIPCIAL